MLKNTILSIAIIFLFKSLSAQSKFTTDPSQVGFSTHDIENFWKAFDSFSAGTKGNPFNELYIKPGSPGLEGFMENRIINGDSLLLMVRSRKEGYIKIRENSYKILKKEKQCRATFYAMKYWYPETKFPPVYFVIGRFNSGGHSNPDYGLIIGAEKVTADAVPTLVAHELIHFQQPPLEGKNLYLLAACINEGSADFLGELISGGGMNEETYKYGDAHEKELWMEFQNIMHDREDHHDWLYTSQPKNGRPADLGYWIGYKIAKSYFDNATDKHQAVKDILKVNDFEKFLKDSKYAENFE